MPVRPRGAVAAALALSFLLPAYAADDPAVVAPDEVLVAVLDTGLDAAHPEVDLARVVAWWDFGSEDAALPAPGETWDADRAPFDDHGHGTAVASLVAGRTLGRFPEAKLAVARLDDGHGRIVRLEEAIAWAVDLDADVVVMSVGSLVPDPGALDRSEDAVRDLHASGAVPVVAAGNGLFNSGARAPSETTSPADSPYAFVVGATSKRHGLFAASFSNTDPDVVAWGVDVCTARAGGTDLAAPEEACKGGDPRYGVASGTSFSAPIVAGFVAEAVHAARSAGREPTPDEVREAFMHTARDTPAPYVFEGFGLVDERTARNATAALVAGAAVPPNSEANADAHVAARRLRTAWTETTEPPTGLYVPKGSATPGRIAPSAVGLQDTDAYALDLRAGERVVVDVTYDRGFADLDVLVYRPSAQTLLLRTEEDLVAVGDAPGGGTERVAFVAPVTGTYVLAVEGWVAARDVDYALHVDKDGARAAPRFVGDHLHVGARLLP